MTATSPVTTTAALALEAIEARLDGIIADPPASPGVAREMLRLGEMVLEIWIEAHGGVPTSELKEGFRILALHRQGARGDPSFNACRETARELVYRHNIIVGGGEAVAGDAMRREVVLAAMVARHLCFFIQGKLAEAGLGEFCCSSKSVRGADAQSFSS